MELTEKQKRDYLKLSLSENVGPIAFRDLIRYFGSADKALAHLGDFVGRGRRKLKIATDAQVDAQLDYVQRNNVQLLFSVESDYPKQLRAIEDCPPVLFCKGHTHLLNEISVAIVGTRSASLNGQNLARYMGYTLCEHGYVITSGLARGIDRSAHEGALQNMNGKGGTIAVLGTDVCSIYPQENKELYEHIAERGCLISEMAGGSTIKPSCFSRRNRIISGLSRGVLVIEARLGSGSLVTVRYALDQGREVFAVPGNPLDDRSAGPNQMIQQGATLVSRPEDIISVLDGMKNAYLLFEPAGGAATLDVIQPVQEDDLQKARQLIEESLGAEPVDIDELIRQTGLTAQLVHIVLVEMELTDQIERHPRNRVSKLYKVKE